MPAWQQCTPGREGDSQRTGDCGDPVLEHNTAMAQCCDLLGRIAATREDLIAVLAKGRGRSWHRPGCPGELDRLLHRAIAPDQRMIEGCNEILGEHLRMALPFRT
jgi:hypothetical protein